MVEATKEPAAPQLGDLCIKKLLANVLSSSHPERELMKLEPRVRVLLFTGLRDNVLKLKTVDPKWRQITRVNPYIDKRINLIPGRTKGSLDPVEDFPVIDKWSYWDNFNNFDEDDDNSEDEEWNNTAEDEDVQAGPAWHDSDGETDEEFPGMTEVTSALAEFDEQMEDTEESDLIHWSQDQLYSDARGEELKLCLHTDIYCADCHRRDPDTPDTPDKSVSFTNRISSHLFLFRITVTYGMPPAHPNDTDSKWKITLKHMDGLSELECEDYKGEARVKFAGTEEVSEDALKIFNYLTGERCVHTYDGVIAGAVA
jgi:hypothetical protein